MTTTGAAAGSSRIHGFDIARAIAILGMVLVNYRGMMESRVDYAVLDWISDRLQGRASALFVVLAGIGIALGAKRAWTDPANHLRFERIGLLKRALALFVLGLLNIQMWEWDILHFYGVYMLLTVAFLGAPVRVLLVSAVLFVALGTGFQQTFDYFESYEMWSASGFVRHLLFSGLHPVFPWFGFLLIGLALGRLDWTSKAVRSRVFWAGLTAMVLGEAVSYFGASNDEINIWSSWPRAPGPIYVLAAGGTAVAIVVACVQLSQRAQPGRVMLAFVATGQLALTLYFFHAVAIVVPLKHGLLEQGPLWHAFAYSFAFYAVAVLGSMWWRTRFEYGPLELFLRQISGRVQPGPWGGKLLSS